MGKLHLMSLRMRLAGSRKLGRSHPRLLVHSAVCSMLYEDTCPGFCRHVLSWHLVTLHCSSTASEVEGWQKRQFGRAKASPPGLELRYASPAALTPCLGQGNKTHVIGKCDSAPEGSSHWACKGLMRANLWIPSRSCENIQNSARCVWPPGSCAVLQTESCI